MHSGGSSEITLKKENGAQLATPFSLKVEPQPIGRGMTSPIRSLYRSATGSAFKSKSKSGSRFRRRNLGADALDDQPVVLRAPVGGEVEHGLLEVGGEVDVAVEADDLVFL